MRHLILALILPASLAALANAQVSKKLNPDNPRALDPRLEVRLFAAAPDIVHPIGLDFDAKGRLLVIESHTHFPPKDYQGPKHDRIRVLEDTDGDGKADRFTTFFESTKATMDIAVHPDGAVYLATRNEILRLRDTDGDGKADKKERLVFLDTKGDYPHNGLSGLCFDSKGNLYFGMGENLGASYKLIGADGTTHTDEGEGGNIFWCTADGKKLRRVATGFWNPFGICRDIYGRLFAVDNDPDAMPPCRLLHVVEGGDYGYQFRYGRSGRHPFQAWNGQIPGTLPMMAGTGEAPCEIISYESDGLPAEYRGDLLVASWADHRIERYKPEPRGASFQAERKILIQGGKDFRPVGIALAPDGSLFISDWVLADYTLHGKGAIWQVRWKDHKNARPPDALYKALYQPLPEDEGHKALVSLHRPLREAAARRHTIGPRGIGMLGARIDDPQPRVRAAALTALINLDDYAGRGLPRIADRDQDLGMRAMAVAELARRGQDMSKFLHSKQPAELRREAIAGLKEVRPLFELLKDADPFLRQAAVQRMSSWPDLASFDLSKQAHETVRLGLLLANRASGKAEGKKLLPTFLADPSEDVRFLAAKWIADQKLTEFRPLIVEALKDKKVNVRLFLAYSTALARLDGQEVGEGKLADYFFARLADAQSPAELRVLALQMVPAHDPRLTLDMLGKLAGNASARLRLEAVRALSEHPTPKRMAPLLRLAMDPKRDEAERAQAVLGLADQARELIEDLLILAAAPSATVADEALRALVNVPLTAAHKERLRKIARPSAAPLVSRLLGQPFAKDRPPPDQLDAWLKRLEGPADAEAGRRVFFHPRLGGCYRCHKVEGRGKDLGPDLGSIGQRERKFILESILQPNNLVAPHYQSWHLETADGRVRTGMLVRTYLDEYTYLDAKGELFALKTGDLVENRPVPVSIMPAGSADLFTDQELRDLLAYLAARK